MWRPIDSYSIRRVLAVMAMFAAAFVAFRLGFAEQSAERAVPLIAAGGMTSALAVGCLTMNRPARIFAGGLMVLLFWGAFFGGGAALLYVIYWAS